MLAFHMNVRNRYTSILGHIRTHRGSCKTVNIDPKRMYLNKNTITMTSPLVNNN